MRKTQTIPKAPVARILFKAGAKRVSDSAAETFANVLLEIGSEIATKAVMISKHAGRKTIHDSDINLAAKQ